MFDYMNSYLFYGAVFFLGACVGSFLNVCIYRMPIGGSIIYPFSYCEHCRLRLKWYHNIPLLSWFILGGKCGYCKKGIHFRHPLIEGLTGILFVICAIKFDGLEVLAAVIFVCFIIPAIFIDWDHMIIPDFFTIGGFLVGVILVGCIPGVHKDKVHFLYYTPFMVMSFKAVSFSLISAFISSGLLLWIGFLAEAFLKKEAIGFGDVKLLGVIGVFCGWQGALFALFGGATLGVVFLLPYFLYKIYLNKSDETLKGRVIPFGPWLGIAAILYKLFFNASVNAYFYNLETLFKF